MFSRDFDMPQACEYAARMNKHIQIKSVDARLHRKLKIKAIDSGMSLSEFLKRELENMAERPTNAEIMAKLRALPPVAGDLNTVRFVREDRDGR